MISPAHKNPGELKPLPWGGGWSARRAWKQEGSLGWARRRCRGWWQSGGRNKNQVQV